MLIAIGALGAGMAFFVVQELPVEGRIVAIENDQALLASVPPLWMLTPETLDAKRAEAFKLLEPLELKVSTKKFSYTERRASLRDGMVGFRDEPFSDYEREFGLAVLDLPSGELKTITITKHGAQLVAPSGYTIDITERGSGIRWNGLGTQFRVLEPEHQIVFALKYPIVHEKGTRRLGIEYFTYLPYHPDVMSQGALSNAAGYVRTVIGTAREDLRQRQVRSKAFPEKLVADILPDSYFERLPFLEQSDYVETVINTRGAVQRVLGLLYLNSEKAFTQTVSKAKAIGWVQFTDNTGSKGQLGTYSGVRKDFPDAGLVSDFRTGASDHQNSMKAAMLLHDKNLAKLVAEFGREFVEQLLKERPEQAEEILAAMYNGGDKHTIRALHAGASDWAQAQDTKGKFILPSETRQFMAKLRLFREGDLPMSYLMSHLNGSPAVQTN